MEEDGAPMAELKFSANGDGVNGNANSRCGGGEEEGGEEIGGGRVGMVGHAVGFGSRGGEWECGGGGGTICLSFCFGLCRVLNGRRKPGLTLNADTWLVLGIVVEFLIGSLKQTRVLRSGLSPKELNPI